MPVEIQIVRAPPWSDKRFYLRRARDYSKPAKAELRTRIAFAETAHGTFGEKMTGDLPPVAERLSEEMAGRTYGRKRSALEEEIGKMIRAEMVKRGAIVEAPQIEVEAEARKWLRPP